MGNPLTITYYTHSGFSVASGNILLVFDYWTGEHGELPQEKRISPEMLARYSKIYVFISHEHPDHLDPVVFEWRHLADVTYIVSADMPVGTRGKRMAPGDEMTLSDRLKVKAYESTDLGVSFMVHVDGYNIFHAGDLNFWHWRSESTVREIELADQDFRTAVAPIVGEKIDLAFFPVDPRQGKMYEAGANYFIMTVKPRIMVPMHFWGRGDLAAEFARAARCKETETVAMTHFGEQMLLEKDENDVLTATLLTVERGTTSVMPVVMEAAEDPVPPEEMQVDFKGLEGEDPFGDSDLPVNMDDDK